MVMVDNGIIIIFFFHNFYLQFEMWQYCYPFFIDWKQVEAIINGTKLIERFV